MMSIVSLLTYIFLSKIVFLDELKLKSLIPNIFEIKTVAAE